ncbi:hypothetical protein [Parasitella parasitica]|uniref:Ndc10 domain-containing protein n=1 Tax=Parasitella parasitica TaxID=35722 RepID=A0A0B7NXI2_9FUNG|nr:hypothetical protein [Parasitella parasitica]
MLAMARLSTFQFGLEIVKSIQWPSPRDIDGLWTTIKEYGHRLVYDQVLTNPDRAAHCIIKDSYKPRQLLKILKSLWLSNKRTSLRELLSYFTSTPCASPRRRFTQHRETQEAITAVIHMNKGKDMKQSDFKSACAMRHENISRCPVSAFAFFLLRLFQNGAPFLNKKRWQYWKVIRGSSNPEESLSHSQHAGSREAHDLNIPINIMRQGGNRKDRIGRLETNYLGKIPKENDLVNTKKNQVGNPFSSSLFKSFAEEVNTATKHPQPNRLEQCEHLVPDIAKAQNDMPNRMASLQEEMLQMQQHSTTQFAFLQHVILTSQQQQQQQQPPQSPDNRLDSILAQLAEN